MPNPLRFLRRKLASSPRPPGEGVRPRRRVRLVLGLIAAVLLLYYPLGMLFAHKVNDDVRFTIPGDRLLPNGSRAVSMAIVLIERETQQTTWVANKP